MVSDHIQIDIDRNLHLSLVVSNHCTGVCLDDIGQVRGIIIAGGNPAGQLLVPDTVVTYIHRDKEVWLEPDQRMILPRSNWPLDLARSAI